MVLVEQEDLLKNLGFKNFNSKKFSQVIFKLLKLHQINELYGASISDSAVLFIENLFREIQIKIECDPEELNRIPLTGKFISVSNHPYGAIDGLILMYLIAKKRNDIKIFANYLLTNIEPLKELIIPVDPFTNKKKTSMNMRAMLQGIDHLKHDHPIALFPAGEVSSIRGRSGISDKEWSPNTIKFIKNASAPIIPIYFHGNNSFSFHFLGMINEKLRTIKLASELTNKRNKTIRVRIGKVIPVDMQEQFEDTKMFGRYLRAKTYALGSALNVNKFYKFKAPLLKTKHAVIDAVHPLILLSEINQLSPEDIILQQGSYKVICTAAKNIPNTIMEIGRLRELTFRGVGEGTNKPMDIDEFDLNYKHLFIWDEENEKIVGGYRIGFGAELHELHKKKGFYLNSLFRFSRKFEPILKSSIELGRSFVIEAYQKKPFPLFLLWKGIMRILLKHPEYQYIIGPVSISNKYSTLSKNLMIDYLKAHYFDYTKGAWVKARKEYKVKYKNPELQSIVQGFPTMTVLDQIIEDVESSRFKVPVLVKKYIDQGAKILAFNKDPKFNDSIDGLMLLDVSFIPLKTLNKLAKETGDPNEVAKRFNHINIADLANVPQA